VLFRRNSVCKRLTLVCFNFCKQCILFRCYCTSVQSLHIFESNTFPWRNWSECACVCDVLHGLWRGVRTRKPDKDNLWYQLDNEKT
jgi:hypothetical protein